MITVYKTATCPRCRLLTQWLDEQGINHTTRDLEDPETITDLRIAGFFGLEAPILQIGETFYPASWLFSGEMLETGKIRGVLA